MNTGVSSYKNSSIAPGVPDIRSLKILWEMGYVVLHDLGAVWPVPWNQTWMGRDGNLVPFPHIIWTFEVPRHKVWRQKISCTGEIG